MAGSYTAENWETLQYQRRPLGSARREAGARRLGGDRKAIDQSLLGNRAEPKTDSTSIMKSSLNDFKP